MESQLRQIRGHSFWDCFGEAPVVVDLGANVGKFAEEFLCAHPDAHLLLVEGDPYLTGILERTFASHPEVQLYRGLVGPQSARSTPFFLCKVPEGNSVLPRFSDRWAPGESQEIRVPMISLPSLFELAAYPRIDLLKIDIEGSEWDLLDALTEEDMWQVQQVTVEFHDFMDPQLRPRTESCIARLRAFGYTVRCRGTEHGHGSPYVDCLFYRQA